MMSDVEHERLVARVAAQSLALHALLERLILAGVLEPADLPQMRDFGLAIAQDMQALSSTSDQIAGARVAEEVTSFFAAMDVPRR